jgi:hypothetical protein
MSITNRPLTCAIFGLAVACTNPGAEYCADSCPTAGDGVCDATPGGACAPGTDCWDCGPNLEAEESAPFRITTDNTREPARTSAPREDTCVPTDGGMACEEWSCSGSRTLVQAGGGFVPECEGGVGEACTATSVGCPTIPGDSSAYWECRDGEQGVGCYFAGSDSLLSGAQVTHCSEYGVCDNGTPVERCVRIPAFWRPDDLDTDLFFNASLCSTWFQIADWRRDCGSCNDACNLSVAEAEPHCAGGGDACGGCPDGTSCVDGTCVGDGALRFTLQWSSENDLDLYVLTPAGNRIYYGNRSADGGMLDRDDTTGGPGSIENIFFTAPENGTYEYWVDNYSGSAASFNLTVFKGGSRADMRGGSVESGGESGHYTIDFP